jgi:hypothetical protein
MASRAEQGIWNACAFPDFCRPGPQSGIARDRKEYRPRGGSLSRKQVRRQLPGFVTKIGLKGLYGHRYFCYFNILSES